MKLGLTILDFAAENWFEQVPPHPPKRMIYWHFTTVEKEKTSFLKNNSKW